MTWPRALLALAAAALVVLLALRWGIGWYLNSATFHRRVSGTVSRVLKGEGSFLPITFSGGTFYSAGFAAQGHGHAFFSELRADEIRALFNWRGMWRRRWQIDELTVQKLEVRFAENRPRADPTAPALARTGTIESGGGWKVDLRQASVANSDWHWLGRTGTSGRISGSRFTLRPTGDAWFIDASGGKVSQQGWPDLELDSAKLRYDGTSLFITQSELRSSGTGRISVHGEINFATAARLQADLIDVPIEPVLLNDWRARLKGRASGVAKIVAPLDGGALRIEGQLSLGQGQIEALPILDQIATFTRTERFRRLVLTRGSCSFTRDDKLITAKDVVLESEGLLRVEGAFTVVNDQIDGLFQIGVTAASLQWLPGSQTRVFTIARDGYYWTPLRVTGPVAHPNEDLTARLLAAAAGEILQKSQDAVLDTARSLLDLVPR